jgi:cyclase
MRCELIRVGFPIVWAGPFSNWIAITDKFLSMDVEAFVPGHGHVGTKEDVQDVKDVLSWFVNTADKAYAEGERDPIALAYRTKIPEKWKNYGETERVVMNFCAYWKELDSNYRMPEFFELMNIAGLYHEFLAKGGPP